jgi:hypothetical protein
LDASWGLIVSKSTDLGNTWSNPPIQTVTVNYPTDKEMIVADNLPVDPASLNAPYVNRLYIVSTYSAATHLIQFHQSNDGGATFSTPIQLAPANEWGHGGSIATGPNHEIYVTWAHKPNAGQFITNYGFAESLDGGATFTNQNSVYPSDLDLAPYVDLEYGMLNNGYQMNCVRVNGFPVIAVDRSCGPYRGRIYIAYNATDPITFKSRIIVKYKDPVGNSWINCNALGNATPSNQGIVDDNGIENWMPSLCIDQATGNVYVAYLKASSDPYPTGDFLTDAYLAFSDDGGQTFGNVRVSGNSWQHFPAPRPNGFTGDYISVDAYEGNIYVAWCANDVNQPSQKIDPCSNQTSLQLFPHYNVFTSRLICNTSTAIKSGTGIDLNLNGIRNLNDPSDPTSPSSYLYEASNSISLADDHSKFRIYGNSPNCIVTFRAGKYIHFKPSYSNVKDFGALNGSSMHAYISAVDPCTSPFRINYSIAENSTEKRNEDSNYRFYPNPTSAKITLEYYIARQGNLSIWIDDSLGGAVSNILTNEVVSVGNHKLEADIDNLKSGIYFLNIVKDGFRVVKKLVKL